MLTISDIFVNEQLKSRLIDEKRALKKVSSEKKPHSVRRLDSELSKQRGPSPQEVAKLKDLKHLEDQADKVLRENLHLLGDLSEDNPPELDNYNSVTGRREKSGLRQVSSDSKTKNPQLCPQEFLRLEHVRDPIKYEDLDLRLFVAGELNIIDTENISRSEKRGRMKILKDILFLAGCYEWKGILDFYAAIINQIEMGVKTWESSFLEERQLVLLPFAKRVVLQKETKIHSHTVNPRLGESLEQEMLVARQLGSMRGLRRRKRGIAEATIEGNVQGRIRT